MSAIDPRHQSREQAAMRAVDAAWAAYQGERDPSTGEWEALANYQAAHPQWTPEMAAAVPTEDEAGNEDDPTCYYRFLAPHGARRAWYVMAATSRGDDVVFLVWAHLGTLQNAEIGYVSLSELRSIRGPFHLNVEADRYFAPTPLSEILKSHGAPLPGPIGSTDGMGSP